MIETVEDNVSGVYLIQCNKNGKNYIGSSKNIKERWREHISCLRDKRHHSMKLQEDWDKFGEDQFEFHILVKTDYANAKKLEDEYIKKFKSDKFNVHMSLDNETSIGINWNNEDMFIEVVNVRNYEKDSDFILVDVA